MTATAMPPQTLVERLRAIYATETGFGNPLNEAAGQMPTDELAKRRLEEVECETMDWGAMVGLAFGLARMEDPCEGLQSVGERAIIAAREVWAPYAGDQMGGLLEREEVPA
ncbi:MAG: hypothetical protein ACRDK7_11960 [Solirubrobacteraceae bacterium]